MEDKQIVKLAAIVILAPVVIGGIATVCSYTYVGIATVVNKIKFNKKIKNGLKDGSIVEHDGQFYEVIVDVVGEA